MTWSTSARIENAETIDDVLDDLAVPAAADDTEERTAVKAAQLACATAAVKAALGPDDVGGGDEASAGLGDGPWQVSLSGHASDDGTSRSISVSINSTT